jgi:hypothetical protein
MIESRYIRRFEIHPQYYSAEYDFDVCILFFDRLLEYTDDIQPVCLTAKDEVLPEAGEMVYVSGWGLTQHEGEISLKLKEAAVPIVRDEH